jgi:hypothetical protein
MAVLAYFSYGISVFSLKNCSITILKIMRYTVFAILDSKTAVIDKICLRYYGIEYPPMPSSLLIKLSFLAYLKKHGLNKNPQPNLTSTKAHLHNRKISRSPRKKVKKKTSRLKITEENISRTKESNKATISCNKTKQNQSNENLIPNSHRTVKNQDKNNSNELNCSTSVIICSVRKLISSYSTKNISTSSQTLWKNPKVSQRPKTSCGKKAAVHYKSEIKIKRQSCPPPLFQPSESLPLVSRNVKLKKVYYSEPQSHMLAGVPRVPPVSPLNSKLNHS